MNERNPIDVLDAKLQAWPVSSMGFDEQVEHFKSYNALLSERFIAGDPVESLTVHESLYDAVSKAMAEMSLPENFKDETGASWEDSNRDFNRLCQNVAVRSAPTGYFSQVPLDVVDSIEDPEPLFVQVMTRGRREAYALEQYDQAKGITLKLQRTGLPFTPTYAEKRLLCMVAALFEMEQPAIDESAVLQATAPQGIMR